MPRRVSTRSPVALRPLGSSSSRSRARSRTQSEVSCRVSSPQPTWVAAFDPSALVDAIEGLQAIVVTLGAGQEALTQRFNDAGKVSFWVEYLKYFCIHLFLGFQSQVVYHPHISRSG